MADVKELLIELKLQNEQLIKAVSDTKVKMEGLDKQQTRLQKTTRLLKTGYIAVAGVLTGVLARGIGALIRKASDAEETLSKFNTVFQSIRKEADAVAKNLSRNFGLSALESRRLLASTGDLLVGFGFTQESALDLSEQVQKLAVDLASFTNFSGGAEGASDALTKALLGERESVKSLGISILEADVKTKVLENTQKGLRFETERQAKAYATLQIAQEQSKLAIGDFERTSTSFANQVRILRANLEDLAVRIGNKLLPVFAPILQIFNDIIKPAKELDEITQDLIKSQEEYKKVLDELTKSQDELTESERNNLKIRKSILELDIVRQIDELNKAYENQRNRVAFLNRSSRGLAVQLEEVGEKLANARGATIELNKEEAALLGLINRNTREFQNLNFVTVETEKALRAFSGAQVKTSQRTKEFTEENEKLQTAVDQIARAINSRIITERDLIGLNDELLKRVRSRIEILPELEAKERQIEAARKRREEAARERLALQQKQRTEIERLIREGEDQEEDAALLRKLERIDVFLERFRLSKDQEVGLTRAAEAIKEKIAEARRNREIDATKSSLGSVTSLTSSANKSLFGIGKAASLAQAVINNAQAITKTMAHVSFPANIPLAAAQAAAGGVQIAKIAATQPPRFQEGGVIDRVAPANIPGEDGIVGARIGESVLNVRATAQLGREAIDALNEGRGIRPNVQINVADGNGAIEILNDYFKQFGTSDRGESI